MEQVKAEAVELKPVDQTVLGIGNPRANCFQACLAMVTGLQIGQCVDITDPEIEDGQWIAPVEAWAAKHGLRFVTGIKAPMDRPYIANGPTAEREGVHGVVCVGHELFHDPHPSRAGIVSVNWYGWFVPLYANPQPAAVDGLVRAAAKSCSYSGSTSPIAVTLNFHTMADREAFLEAHVSNITARQALAQSDVERIVDLELALSWALGVLIQFEPGDSRAVSNEFVAAAALQGQCGNERQECRDILTQALAQNERTEDGNG